MRPIMIFIDKNRAYWFRRFKDVSRQKIATLFGPPSMISRGGSRVGPEGIQAQKWLYSPQFLRLDLMIKGYHAHTVFL